MKLCFILTFTFVLCNLKVDAQHYSRIFDKSLKDVGLEFRKPKGFRDRDSITLYNCGNNKMRAGTIIYSMVNEDSSLIIAFFNLTKSGNENYDPLDNVIRQKNYYADSIKNSVLLYNKAMAKKIYNADVAGEFSRDCPISFLGRYNTNRTVFIANSDFGEASIMYFFTDNIKKDITKIIKETSGMLRFKSKLK